MAAWRKELYAARHREEKREVAKLGKLLSHTEAENLAKRHPLAQSMSRRNPCAEARRTETCEAPRHVDASGDFIIPNDRHFFFSPVQQTTSGIGHRVKYFFRVGNQYAECEKQQQ